MIPSILPSKVSLFQREQRLKDNKLAKQAKKHQETCKKNKAKRKKK